MDDFEIISKDAEVDTYYGLYDFYLTKDEIIALMCGKKLYSTVNCCEYAITIEMAESEEYMTIKEAMEEILRIKDFSMTNKEAIQILKEELKSNRQNKEYSWQLDDAYKMAIVALAITMTEEEKNTIEKPKNGQGDNYDKWYCPICSNTLWTIWQEHNRPDHCSVCGQLIDNRPFGGVENANT